MLDTCSFMICLIKPSAFVRGHEAQYCTTESSNRHTIRAKVRARSCFLLGQPTAVTVYCESLCSPVPTRAYIKPSTSKQIPWPLRSRWQHNALASSAICQSQMQACAKEYDPLYHRDAPKVIVYAGTRCAELSSALTFCPSPAYGMRIHDGVDASWASLPPKTLGSSAEIGFDLLVHYRAPAGFGHSLWRKNDGVQASRRSVASNSRPYPGHRNGSKDPFPKQYPVAIRNRLSPDTSFLVKYIMRQRAAVTLVCPSASSLMSICLCTSTLLAVLNI